MAAEGIELATAYVSILPSTAGLAPAMSRQFAGVEAEADKAGKRSGKRLGGGMVATVGRFAGPLLAAAGIMEVGKFIGDSISEAREAQKVGALTESIIKSTGGAAKISAAQVGDLAGAISNKTGIDDEAIQSGSNLLLTFKNVRNEVGAGSDIFNRATQAAVDLSAAGFGSIESGSKMLGKALNDPVKGISALSRAGVTFTEDQKKMIKGMVEAGDVLGAQKIIMKEVESQVGGAAAASATAGEKLAVTWGNFQEKIGTMLLPILDKLFGVLQVGIEWLANNLGGAFDALGGLSSKTGALSGVSSTLARIWTSVLQPAFVAVGSFIRTEVVPRIGQIWQAIQNLYKTAVPIVIAFVNGMIERIRPLMPTIKAIFTTVGEIVKGALDLIKATIERVTTIIAWVWKNWGKGIMDTIAFVWEKVLNIIRPALGTIQSVIKVFTSILKGDWSGAWNALIGVFKGIWKTIRAVIDGAVGLLQRGLKTAWDAVVSVAGTVWSKITSAIAGPIDRVLQFIQENLIDKLNGLFSFLHIPLYIKPIWVQGYSGVAAKGSAKKNKYAYARGGVMPGYTPGRDVHEFWSPTAGSLSLSGGEAIMRPEFTRAVGGARGVAALNAAARRGQRFAGGGIWEAIGNVANGFLSFMKSPGDAIKDMFSRLMGALGSGPWARLIGGAFNRMAGPLVERILGMFGGIPGQGVNFGGYKLDADTARRIKAAGGFKVIQGSWSHNPLSQGTHAGAGAADLHVLGGSTWAQGVRRLRNQGLLAMFRNWPGNQHIHALNPFVQGLSPQALAQVRRARANNGIFAQGGVFNPHVAAYDTGGVLSPGWTMAYNGLGRDEYVRTGHGGDYYYFSINARDLEGLRTLEEFIKHARRQARQRDGVVVGG